MRTLPRAKISVSQKIFDTSNNTLRCAVRDKSQLSGLTVPVGGGKGKKNWEQLQQESSEGGTEPRTEGVQVGTVCSGIGIMVILHFCPGPGHAEKRCQGWRWCAECTGELMIFVY